VVPTIQKLKNKGNQRKSKIKLLVIQAENTSEGGILVVERKRRKPGGETRTNIQNKTTADHRYCPLCSSSPR
jgi:hypothetical protein